jgi:hypothetical protein
MEEFRFLSPVELLELLRKQQQIKGLPSTDYRLAKILGMTPNGLSHTLHGRGSLSDENAIKLADELILPRSYVVACMARFRSKNPEVIEMWENIAAQAFKNIAFVVLGFGLHYVSFLNFLPFQ